MTIKLTSSFGVMLNPKNPAESLVVLEDACTEGRLMIVKRFDKEHHAATAESWAARHNKYLAGLAGGLPAFIVSFNVDLEKLTDA